MKKGKKLYEGKAKIIYATSDKNLVIQYFKDDATAFNNQKNLLLKVKEFWTIEYQNISLQILNKLELKII